jgi:very-short-patch-repair endonuclease
MRLRARQVAGLKFRRQHRFGPYVLDFFCLEKGLVVEVDGSQHLTEQGLLKDAQRTRFLEPNGLRVLRFTNLQVLQETNAVLQAIWEAAAVSDG